jgi:extradiol dioxygenase family protein
MAVQLNHTIVPSHNKKESAQFLSEILGLDPPEVFGHFVAVQVANGVTLDYDDADHVTSTHYAFLVSDDDFDGIFERVTARGITYWADPRHELEGQISTRHGGRGFYFSDPAGHNMEVLTRPYTR